MYGACLADSEITSIYGNGFGDFQKIEIIGAGKTKITASQSGNDLFEAARPVDNYLTVYKVSQSIIFDPINDHSVGDFPFALNATSSSGLPVSYASSNPSVASTVGNYVYVHGAGVVTIYASQDGNEKFEKAPDQNQTFEVKYGNLFSRLRSRTETLV